MEFPDSQEEPLLHNVFAILWVAKHLSGCSLEPGHAGCEELVQFSVIHVDGKKGWLMESRTGNALIFDAQVASLGRWLKRCLECTEWNARMIPIGKSVVVPKKDG